MSPPASALAAAVGVLRPPHLLNERVRLRPESEAETRRAYELAIATEVRWAQCPRCRSRFWYVVNSETPQAELWFHGAQLRRRLLEEPCAAHGGVARYGPHPEGVPVRVELFGVARLTARERQTEMAAVTSLREVVGALAARWPQLVGPVIGEDGDSLNEGYIFNINGRDFVRDLDRPVAPGDTVLLLAAAAGG